MIALRHFTKAVSGVKEEEESDLGIVEAAFRAADEFDHLQQRLEAENAQLRERLDRLGDIGQEKTSKEQKIAAIVTYADNARKSNQDCITVLPETIKGVADVSERYAYRLVDDMVSGDGENGTVGPDGYDWALDPQERPRRVDQDKPQKGVIIDFKQPHDDPAALNKFINESTAQGWLTDVLAPP